MGVAYTLEALARQLDCRLQGDATIEVSSVAALETAAAGQLSFVVSGRYAEQLAATGASAVIVPEALATQCPVAALVSDNPHLTYARAAALLHPPHAAAEGVHPSAVVAPSALCGEGVSIGPNAVVEDDAVLGAGVIVGPGCVVGRGVRIGDHTRLYANVTLYHDVKIGCRGIIHSGTVVGGDGFGLANDNGRWEKIPQLGTVIVGDDVEIGANTAIDRGALEDTVIEDGVKLDNQVHVAHNVTIGADSAIAGCVGIAGSTRVGQRCQVAGAVAITGHITIADDVIITGMSMVTGNIPNPGQYSSGIPLDNTSQWRKNAARFRNLDALARKVAQLEKLLKQSDS